jgi:hypothetical protein
VTCHPGEKNTGIEPHQAHAFPTAERFVVVVVVGERERDRQRERERERERSLLTIMK